MKQGYQGLLKCELYHICGRIYLFYFRLCYSFLFFSIGVFRYKEMTINVDVRFLIIRRIVGVQSQQSSMMTTTTTTILPMLLLVWCYCVIVFLFQDIAVAAVVVFAMRNSFVHQTDGVAVVIWNVRRAGRRREVPVILSGEIGLLNNYDSQRPHNHEWLVQMRPLSNRYWWWYKWRQFRRLPCATAVRIRRICWLILFVVVVYVCTVQIHGKTVIVIHNSNVPLWFEPSLLRCYGTNP